MRNPHNTRAIIWVFLQCILLHNKFGSGHSQPHHDNGTSLHSSNSSNNSIPSLNGNASGLFWEDLGCRTANGESILQSSSGFVANGQVCGILGPSGSGKSTFLSLIAGRSEVSLLVDGLVRHVFPSTNNDNDNNKSDYHCATVLPDRVAWLQQEDAFLERLTVQETLDVAVYLEWPQLAKRQRDAMAQTCLESLGLSKLGARRVGSPKNANSGASHNNKGATLSGGELRRLSVALELVTKPHLLIADEPTSGIDSKMSETVMAAITSLAKEQQIPSFCTLHQPRSSIWHMLDAIILMAPGGRVCYVGSCDDSLSYFSDLGYDCPNETNPAEFLIDLVSIDTEDKNQAIKDRHRIDQLANAFQQYNQHVSNNLQAIRLDSQMTSMPPRRSFASVAPGGILRRVGALLRRSWRQSFRSFGLHAIRFVMSSGTALLLSQIFPSVVKGPPTSNSVTDRICVLTFGTINMFLISVVKTIGIFSNEKPVVQRERFRNDYTSLEYILTKAFSEFPFDATFALVFTTTLKLVTGLAIQWNKLSLVFSLMSFSGASLGYLLGSITKSESAAITLAMPVVILFMVVGVINPSGVDHAETSPLPLQIVKTASPIAAAVEALMVAEFSSMEFASPKSGMQQLRDLPRMGGLALVRNGDEALGALGLSHVEFRSAITHLSTLLLVNLGLSWAGLAIMSNARMERWMHRVRTFLFPPSQPGSTQEKEPSPPVKQSRKEKRRQTTWGLPRPKFQL